MLNLLIASMLGILPILIVTIILYVLFRNNKGNIKSFKVNLTGFEIKFYQADEVR